MLLSNRKIFNSTIRKVYSGVFFLLLVCGMAEAQLRIIPLPGDGQISRKTTANISKRTKADEPLTLPFLDDFSKVTYDFSGSAAFPDTSVWENGSTVWVNSGIGRNVPTINVATFDGINATGNPYEVNDNQLSGLTDSLVSKKIDLSATAIDNPVLPSHRDLVFLSFFYQWRGYAEPPDENDFLQVQFKNDQQKWINVDTIYVDETKPDSLFYPAIIKVSGDQFFHAGFQFRIRSFGVQAGPFDTWNVDYIYLNNYRHKDDLSFPDQAITSPLTTFLPNQYRAIPYSHFLKSPGSVMPSFRISNLRNSPEPLTYQTSGTFTKYFESLASIATLTTAEYDIDNPGSVLQGFDRGKVTVQGLPEANDATYFDPAADSVDVDLKVRLFTGDNQTKFGDRADDYTYEYEPLDFRINDTLTTSFALRNYYAYDDGVAEYAVELIESGNVVAYEFQIPEGLDEPLTLLEYIDVYFPPYGVSSNQNVDFFIFKENEAGGKPGENMLRIPSVSTRSQGINTFQRIGFQPALQMTETKFYIGWRQPVEGFVFVGLDYSNDTGQKMFVNTSGGVIPDQNSWTSNNTVHGSLMIRPVFGKGLSDPKTGIEDEPKLAVYPNPNTGSFFIEGIVEQIEIINMTGQSVPFRSERDQMKTLITMTVTTPGLYVLKYSKGNKTMTEKIAIAR